MKFYCVLREKQDFVNKEIITHPDDLGNAVQNYIDNIWNFDKYSYFDFRNEVRNLSIDSIEKAGFDDIFKFEEVFGVSLKPGFYFFTDTDDFVCNNFVEKVKEHIDNSSDSIFWNYVRFNPCHFQIWYMNNKNSYVLFETNHSIVKVDETTCIHDIHAHTTCSKTFENKNNKFVDEYYTIDNKNICSVSNIIDKKHSYKEMIDNLRKPNMRFIDKIDPSLLYYVNKMNDLHKDLVA